MYGTVNTDLNMSAGKIAAQFGHGVQKVVKDIMLRLSVAQKLRDFSKNNYYKDLHEKWEEWQQSAVKVVLGAPTELFNSIIKRADDTGIEGALIFDEARTELAKPDNTVFVFYPYRRSEIGDLVSQLPLLKTSDIVTGLQQEVRELREKIARLEEGLKLITPGPLD
jgi:peptidyl-tRNA hydrolase